MDVEELKVHLQSLEEYVLDEEKIVTYRWLSKVLSIHVNIAKELLHKFSSDPAHVNNVFLTHLISGKTKDGLYQVLVVGQDKFEDKKLDFEFITSQHVYSVQKKKETPSPDLLYMVNSEKVENEVDVLKQIGVIKCAASIERAEDEVAKLRLNSLVQNLPSKSDTPVQRQTSAAENVKKEVVKTEDKATTGKVAEGKGSANKTQENKTKAATGGIAAMFAAQKSSSSTSANAKPKAKPVAKKGAINSFFSAAPKTESPPKSEAKTNGKHQTDEPMDIDELSNKLDDPSKKPNDSSKKLNDSNKISDNSTKKPDEKKSVKEREISPVKAVKQEVPTSNGKTPKNKLKRKSKSKSSAKPGKTRKRIKVIDSDSSDDMFASEKEDSPEPIERSPSPPPVRKIVDSDDEVIPPTPQPVEGKKNHRKRKVVKDKSYMDDDGFIVTEKVTVYESCSDSDTENKDDTKKSKEEPATKPVKTSESPTKSTKEEEPAKSKADTKKTAKKSPKTAKNSPVSPSKNKQSSLMSFFKKV